MQQTRVLSPRQNCTAVGLVRLRTFPSVLLLLARPAVVALTLVAPFSAPAQTTAGGRWAAATDSARSLVQAFMREGKPAGLSVAVGVDGQVVWSEGFGYADLEQAVPVSPETRFRIGSISKSLTAAALGLLFQEGRLDLDAQVQRYVPSFPRKRYPVTVRQLAGHIAGIRHYRGDEMLLNRRYASVSEALDIFEDDSLLFEPGTQYSYSSYGWILLSAVVEAAAGEGFLTYMRQRVFEPVGMQRTAPDLNDSIIPNRTRFYTTTPQGGHRNAPAVDNSYKWAGGGFLSTPEDLIRFAYAMLDGRLLMPETVKLFWTSQRLRSGEETGYGIGWRSNQDGEGHWVVSHTGGSVGGTSVLAIHPEARVVLAMTANISDARFGPMPGSVGELFVRR